MQNTKAWTDLFQAFTVSALRYQCYHTVSASDKANTERVNERIFTLYFDECDLLGTSYIVHDARASLAHELCDAIRTLTILRGHTTG